MDSNNELLQAIGRIMDEKLTVALEPIRADIADLKVGQEAIRAEMQEGFDRLEESINMAAGDAAVTERRLKQHIEDTRTA